MQCKIDRGSNCWGAATYLQESKDQISEWSHVRMGSSVETVNRQTRHKIQSTLGFPSSCFSPGFRPQLGYLTSCVQFTFSFCCLAFRSRLSISFVTTTSSALNNFAIIIKAWFSEWIRCQQGRRSNENLSRDAFQGYPRERAA